MWVKKQQLEPDMKQRIGSKLGREYDKAVYGHPPYLNSIQSTSYEMLGWMNHKLESRLNIIRKNINNLRYADGRNGRGTKEPLGEGKRGE